MTDEELLQLIEKQRNLMVSVATGGPRIDQVKNDYRLTYDNGEAGLRERGMENPNPYPDLWEWYGRWTSGDLPSYQSRRQFVAEMFGPSVHQIRNRAAGRASTATDEPTGWTKVDRTVGEIRKRLAQAQTEEQFQAVGLLCREALISLAQSVYDRERHPSLDDTEPSDTDAKRMLEAYLAVELSGSSNLSRRFDSGGCLYPKSLQQSVSGFIRVRPQAGDWEST